MLRKLRDQDKTKEVAERWQSVYTGIAVICNRKTPPHRDSKGRPEWFDTLASYADDKTAPRFIVNDIGLDLEYSSGAVVGFCGSVLEHCVESGNVEDRVCYAHFMRESVRDRLEAPAAGWVQRSQYLPTNLQNIQEVDDGAVDMDVDEDFMGL